MSEHDYVNRPSAAPDLDWFKRDAAVWQTAGSEARRYALRKKEAMENCEIKLGKSLENDIGNVSPNATNLAR